MRKLTIILIELGMLAGIVTAGYLLPDSTPLWEFLVASGVCFVAGNLLIFRTINQVRGTEVVTKGGPWPHILRALTILAIGWLLVLLTSRRW